MTTLSRIAFHFDGKTLTSKFISTFLAIEEVLAFNVDLVQPFNIFMVFAMFHDRFGSSTFGPSPGQIER